MKGCDISHGSQLKEILALELFLFGGILESPENIYRIGPHHCAGACTARDRYATKPQFPTETGTVVAVMEINYVTGEVWLRKPESADLHS